MALLMIRSAKHPERQSLEAVSLSLSNRTRKFKFPMQPIALVKGSSRRGLQKAYFGVSRQRPFRRRFASTLRPPAVFIFARKPCVLARRRTFG